MAEAAALAATGRLVAPLISKLVLKGLSMSEDGIKGNLENLQTTVPQIKQVIEKAEMLGREDDKQLMMVWLRELQDAAYEADNVIDEYDYLLLQRQAKGKFAKAVVSPLQSIASDSYFSYKLKKRLEKLDKIASRVQTFTSMLGISNASSPDDDETMYSNFVTGSEPTEPQIFGRDEERDHILDLLINNHVVALASAESDDHLQMDVPVLPIVGVGGTVGKTTLAQYIYNFVNHVLDLLINGMFPWRKRQTKEGKSSSGQHEVEEAERRYVRQEKGKGTLKEDDGPKNIVNDRPATGITIRERHGREAGRQRTGPAARQGRDCEDTLSDRHAKVPVPDTGAPHLRRGSEIVPGEAEESGTGHISIRGVPSSAATGMEAMSADQGARESSAEEVHPSLQLGAQESCAAEGSHKSESNYHLQMQMDVPVLPIVGVGGVGKTTLAQYIYNNPKIIQHFQERMWINMPQNFDETVITRRMVESVHQDACPTIDNFDTLQRRLKEGLHEKRFLMVLDDVWYDEKQSGFVNRERWGKLLAPLRHGVQGSMVLMTSRTNLVAETLGHNAMQPITLKGLNEQDCFSLFKSYAFEATAYGQQRPDDQNIDHHLMDIGRKIARKIVSKLGGLPLAAKVLGGMLRNKHDVEEWNKVLKIDIWGDITRVLALSYKRLPPLLQQCVAHHGLYPKGFSFSGDYLVRAWIAEGFISAAQHDERPESGDKSMEEIGSNCLNELVFRSFLQLTHSGRFVLHDLMHDVADSVSRHECIRIQKGEKKKAIPPTTKHLCIHVEDLDEYYMENICRLRNLRTLFLFCNSKSKFTLDHGVLHSILNKSKRLRTMDLAGLCIDKLPDSIGDLKHLRFLDLSRSTVKTLPKSFHRLYHLLYLDLSKCNFDSVPEDLSELVNLRRLEADATTLSMIPNLGRLTALQELKEFHVKKKKGHEAGQLKNLANLRGTLCIVNLENISSTSEANEAKLHEKTHLSKVWLEWGNRNTTSNYSDSADEMVLDEFQPPPHITFLGVKRYVGSRAPIWMQPNNLLCGSSLHTLILQQCVRLESLPSLGQLFPHLRELRLKSCHLIRYLPYLPPNLITLELFYPRSLALLTEEELKISTDDPQLIKQVLLEKSEFFKRDGVVTDYLEQNPNRNVNVEEIMSWLESGINPLVHNASESVLSNIKNRVTSLKVGAIKEKLKMMKLDAGNVQQLPSSLQHLDLSEISVDGATLSECLSRLHSLSSLTLASCMCIISLPSREVLSNLKRLKEVIIFNCKMLISLVGLASLTSLEKLSLQYCPNLMTVVPSSDDDNHDQSSGGALLPESLTHLIIYDCGFLDTYMGRCLMGLTRLSYLALTNCQHMTSLPTAEELMHLTSLRSLNIVECELLVSVGGLHVLLSSLHFLHVSKCPGLFTLKSTAEVCTFCQLNVDNLSLLPALLSRKGLESLTNLVLIGSSHNTAFTREQEELFQHLPSLDLLMIHDCERLPSLPSNLTSLTRLKNLIIWDCPQVKSLPTLPMSLEYLNIKRCHPDLEQRCQEGGPDWDLIKHIRRIYFI